MSHIVQIQTEVRDPAAIAAACQRLNLAAPVYGTAKLFSESKTGWQVQLSGWNYPVVVDVNTGQVAYDNYGGTWGDQRCLDEFVQRYAVEKAKMEARKRGHLVTEQTLADGSIKVTVQVGGAP